MSHRDKAQPPLTALLVGHRGTGKTTLAARLSALPGAPLVLDLDEQLEQQQGLSPAQLIATFGLARFRELEAQALRALLDTPTDQDRLIVLGAGCMAIAEGALCVWLHRQGWEQTALKERARLWPQRSPEQELAKMRQEREPVWAAKAHLRLTLEPGELDPDADARLLLQLLGWAKAARESEVALKTWLVPQRHDALSRVVADVRLLGLAGIEARSDVFEDAASLAPLQRSGTPYLASLRHNKPTWLNHAAPLAAALDVDLPFLNPVLDAKLFTQLAPKRLLLSWHPEAHSLASFDALVQAAQTIIAQAPEWQPYIELKYAPKGVTWADLAQVLSLREGCAYPLTVLPQGEAWAWLRPLLMAQGNAASYMPAALNAWRYARDQDLVKLAPSPYDYQDWLPHLVPPTPIRFWALLGQPVRHSVGDRWHRAACLAAPETAQVSYVKIPLPAELDPEQLDQALSVLAQLGIDGLSVTAPFKRLLPQAELVASDLEAANTLALRGARYVASDTDEAGMLASLMALERAGVGPGTIAVIGQGGVSPAVLRAIESSCWTLVHLASARAGFGEDAPAQVTLIVNAGGARLSDFGQLPAAQAWLDLHYSGVNAAPVRALHLHGRVFFEAQAAAQRERWLDGSRG